MANKITLEIRGDDKASATLKSFLSSFDKTTSKVSSGGTTAQRAWRNFTYSLDRSKGVLDNTIRRLTSMQGLLITMAGGYGLSRVASHALDTASSFEQMEIKLDQLTKGKGRETLESLNQWAIDMPINTQKAVDAFVMMKAYGMDPTIKSMETLVDVASVVGEDAVPRIARALGQMQARSKLSAQELMQLSEVGINATKYLRDAFGMTVEEVQKAEIDINKVLEAIMKGMEKDFGGAAKKNMESWQGLRATFESYVTEIEREVMAAGVFPALKDVLGDINDELKTWLETNRELIKIKVPEYVESIRVQAESLWNLLSSNKDLIEYGLIGLLFGRKWAIVGAGLGKISDYLKETVGTHGTVIDQLTMNITEADAKIADINQRLQSVYDSQQVGEFLGAQQDIIPGLQEELRMWTAIKETNEKSLETLQNRINLMKMAGEERKKLTEGLGGLPTTETGGAGGGAGGGPPPEVVDEKTLQKIQEIMFGIESAEMEAAAASTEVWRNYQEQRLLMFQEGKLLVDQLNEEEFNKVIEMEQMKANASIEQATRLEEFLSGEHYPVLLQMEAEHVNAVAALEKKKTAMQKEQAQQATKTMLRDWQTFFKEFGQENEAMFKAYKAVAIAETIIDTYKAAQAAYAAMAGIPVVGPALGVAAAAAAIAAGMARVKAISSTEPGTGAGASMGSTAAVGTYSASPTTGLPEYGSTETETAAERVVHIHLHGGALLNEEAIDNLAEKLNFGVEGRGIKLVSSEVA